MLNLIQHLPVQWQCNNLLVRGSLPGCHADYDLSAFFEKNKRLYYDNLTKVREKGDMLHWLKYFLVGIAQTAEQAVDTLSAVLALKDKLEGELRRNWGRRSSQALDLLQNLFEEPVTSVKHVQKVCGLSTKAANDLVNQFEKAGILIEVSGQTRYRVFIFHEYLDLFKKDMPNFK